MKSEKKRKKLYQQQSNVNIINIGTRRGGGGGGRKRRKKEEVGFDEAASEAIGMLQRLPQLTANQAVASTQEVAADQPSPAAVQIPDTTPWYNKAIDKGLDIGTQVLTAGLEIGVGTKIAGALGGGSAAQGAGQVLGSKIRQTAEEQFDEYVSSFWRPKVQPAPQSKIKKQQQAAPEPQELSFPLLSSPSLAQSQSFTPRAYVPGTGGEGRSRSYSLSDLSAIEGTPQKSFNAIQSPFTQRKSTQKKQTPESLYRPERYSLVQESGINPRDAQLDEIAAFTRTKMLIGEEVYGGKKLEGYDVNETFSSPLRKEKLTWAQIKRLPKLQDRVSIRRDLNITAPAGDRGLANKIHMFDTGYLTLEELKNEAKKLGRRIGFEGENMPLAIQKGKRSQK